MEREREKDLLKELQRLQAPLQDQKARRDNLLRLIQSLQKLQASGPVAKGARSPSLERACVAQAVEEYLTSTDFRLLPETAAESASPPSKTAYTAHRVTRLGSGHQWSCHCPNPLFHLDAGCTVTNCE